MVSEQGHIAAMHVICAACMGVDMGECAPRKDKRKTYLCQWMRGCRHIVGDVDGW